MMHYDAVMLTEGTSSKLGAKVSGTRITISLSLEHYEHIRRLAKSKRVSSAWIIRDAVEKYLVEDVPLFAGKERIL